MAIERTLSIIKPDGVAANLIGKIVGRFEEEGLKVVAAKMKQLSPYEAEGFYAVHKERPFFGELVSFMCSGPVLLMVLEGENAILRNREIMGATNPAEAAPGTIRKLFSKSIGEILSMALMPLRPLNLRWNGSLPPTNAIKRVCKETGIVQNPIFTPFENSLGHSHLSATHRRPV